MGRTWALCDVRSGPDTITKPMQEAQEAGAAGLPMYTLSTRLGPKDANHSYNGIIFDVQAKAPYEVLVTSVSAYCLTSFPVHRSRSELVQAVCISPPIALPTPANR